MSKTIDTPASTEGKTDALADNMGYDVQQAPETTLPETSNAQDVQKLINDTIKEVTVGEDGKYVYPENIDPVLKAAVAATKSYRDNQSGFTKSQQALKESEATAQALRDQLAKHAKPLELTPERKAELDELMKTDPAKWRTEMNSLEAEQAEAVTKMADEVTETVRAEQEVNRRKGLLDDLNSQRGEKVITVDMLDNDIPPRINNKLAQGEITFEEYLVEVTTYLDAGKTVATTETPSTTDLSKANGTGTSGSNKEEGGIDYSQQTF